MASFIYITHFRPMMVVFVFASFSYMSVMCIGYDTPANFVFGDSLVDVGNNDYIPTLSKANYPPNGIDFPNQVPTGRFTNGQTIIDILGSNVSIPCLLVLCVTRLVLLIFLTR